MLLPAELVVSTQGLPTSSCVNAAEGSFKILEPLPTLDVNKTFPSHFAPNERMSHTENLTPFEDNVIAPVTGSVVPTTGTVFPGVGSVR